jgi:hypothetical protein
MGEAALPRRLSWAGGLIATGLVVEVVVSAVLHPLAFVAFLLVACPLVVAGMAVFLWSLVADR